MLKANCVSRAYNIQYVSSFVYTNIFHCSRIDTIVLDICCVFFATRMPPDATPVFCNTGASSFARVGSGRFSCFSTTGLLAGVGLGLAAVPFLAIAKCNGQIQSQGAVVLHVIHTKFNYVSFD